MLHNTRRIFETPRWTDSCSVGLSAVILHPTSKSLPRSDVIPIVRRLKRWRKSRASGSASAPIFPSLPFSPLFSGRLANTASFRVPFSHGGFSFRGGKWSRLQRPDLRNRHFLFQLRQGQPPEPATPTTAK